MLLAIDVGNTNTLFALVDGGGNVHAQFRIKTDGQRTADQYFVWLKQLVEYSEVDVSAIGHAICGSVVPKTVFNLKKLCETYFHCTPLFVSDSNTALPCEVKVHAPQEVGADRLVNTVGAYERYGGDLIVIDFGTAATFDVVDGDGAYLGGVIAPGPNTSMEALSRAAPRLPLIDIARPDAVIGKDTYNCLRSGAYWGYAGMIEGVCGRIDAERGVRHKVIATGGLSSLFAKGLDTIHNVDQDITVRGLISIHRHNKNLREAAE